MGNVNGWQRNFILRCEAVGWSVERGGSDHYKVKDQNGKFLFSFGSTSSDQHALKKTVADAKRAGIEQLETLAKLRAEHERLTRIETDRQANAVALAKVTENLTSSVTLGDVDGVTIIATAPAKIKTPVTPVPKALTDGEELLLADDRVVYRCLKPAATVSHPELTGVCHRIFETASSLSVHISYHSRTSLPPMTRKGHTKPVRELSVQTDVKPDPTADAAPVKSTTKSTAKSTAKSATSGPALALAQRIETAIKMIDRVAATAATLKLDLTGIKDDLVMLPVVDPEVTEKARQFDTLRGIFTGQTDS